MVGVVGLDAYKWTQQRGGRTVKKWGIRSSSLCTCNKGGCLLMGGSALWTINFAYNILLVLTRNSKKVRMKKKENEYMTA